MNKFVMVLIAIVLVMFCFQDIRTERVPYVFRPTEIFESLWRVTEYPVVLLLLPVYSLFMIANVTFYIFVDLRSKRLHFLRRIPRFQRRVIATRSKKDSGCDRHPWKPEFHW